ncbi:response regulator [Paenibacillus sp. ACRRY]|uniref:response regulator n=1 Tax=Paenibacillus sp. ACRRY TaxID=2918208 RepID=UPI001EF41108|nr:response regulator [Paenibacillus sp. ACRRY]MCG7382988.1 response regulator [Paenibacillus sp. ACRRY]
MNTFRMIIVDDEPMIRKGLQALIRRIAPEWTVLGEAANGREALDIIKNVKPDLILTDISMPIMDGIELYTELKREPDSPFVLALSGYTDYSYVRQMLVMGAVDYITKPVEEPILLEKLRQVEALVLDTSHQKLEENEQSQQLIEYWIHQLLSGQSHTPETCEVRLSRLGLPIDGVYFGAVALYINVQTLTPRDRSLYLYFLMKTCQELIHQQGKVIRVEDNMIMALHWSRDEYAIKENLVQFEENLFRFTNVHTQIPMIMGSSPVFSDFRQLLPSWNMAKMEIRFQLVSDSGTDIVEWMAAFKQGQHLQIKSMISETFPLHQPDTWRDRYVSCLAILGHFAAESGLPQHRVIDPLSVEVLSEDQNTLSREIWISKLNQRAEEILDYVQQSQKQTDPPLIARVKRFIHTNINGNLTLQSAADYVRMNPSYLSEVFREATGINFIDYVIQQRMEMAKQLIIKDKHKLYEIAAMVGYQSSKHFTSVFKRVVGILPSEFKRYVDSTLA